MAFFVPVLAAVGGGSAVAGGLLVASTALSAYGAYQQHAAGNAAEAGYKLEAKQAGDAARAREIERKRDLLKALATQNAYAGAGGAEFGGSLAAIARRDIKDSRNDLLADTANTRTQQRVLRARGYNASASADFGAVKSLVDTASDFYAARG